MLRNFYRRIMEKLMRKYRVEIIDDITLSQSRQFALKPITVILLSLLLFGSIVIGTSSIIVFTPSIREHIPGYLDPGFVEDQNLVKDQLTLIERRIREQDTIIKSLRQLAGIEGDSLQEILAKNLEASRNTPEAVNSSPINSPPVESPTPEKVVPPPDKEPQQITEPAIINQSKSPETVLPIIRTSNRSPLLNLFRPLKGKNSQGFNKADLHYGVDIVADEKTLIHSAADGFVVVSEFSDASGLMMMIQSQSDIVTVYKHNSRLLKKVGDYVYAGEPIAVIGNSGENTTGPHLHFELWYKGQPIDPSNYIQFH